MTISTEDKLVCPHCIAPIGRFDHLCPRCGGPVTAHASIDPIARIHSTGHAYRNAVNNPKRIVLIGMWLLISPQIPVLAFALFLTVSNLVAPGHSFQFRGGLLTPHRDATPLEILKLIFVVALLAVYIAVLWKVTSRYVRQRTKRQQELESNRMSTKDNIAAIAVPRWRQQNQRGQKGSP